jgi:hypothetical protein
MVKPKLLLLIISLLITNVSNAQLKSLDKIIVDSDTFYLKSSINISDYVEEFLTMVNQYVDSSIIRKYGNGYRAYWEVSKDSLLLSEIQFFTSSAKNSEIKRKLFSGNTNKVFIPEICDTLSYSSGNLIRKSSTKKVYEFENEIWVNGSKVVKNISFHTLMDCNSCYSRKNEEVIFDSILTVIKREINIDSLSNKYKNEFKFIIESLKFRINTNGEIYEVTSLYKTSILSGMIKNILLNIGPWQPIRERGSLIEEEFQLNLSLNLNRNTVSGDLIYLGN